MNWKGLSDYPFNFQILHEGDAVGLFVRYPWIHVKSMGQESLQRRFWTERKKTSS